MKHYSFLIFLFCLGLNCFYANGQEVAEVLKQYNSIYYELEFDDLGESVIHTKCGEPTLYIQFVCPEDSKDCHFNYEETVYHVMNITEQDNKEEYLLQYKDDFGETAKAIFYYDRQVDELFFTFDGMNLAFVAKEDLTEFTVKDRCDE